MNSYQAGWVFWALSEGGEDAAIDVDDLAVDEVRRGGGENDGGSLQFLDLALATGRGPVLQPRVKLRVRNKRRIQGRVKVVRNPLKRMCSSWTPRPCRCRRAQG